jgi:hypothetical protein
LAIDFFLRAFNYNKYSPINWTSDKFVKTFRIPFKPIDQGPKRFAAKIGFFLSLLIITALLAEQTKTAVVFGIIFTVCAFLESVMAICLGCYMYMFLRQLKIVR